MKSKTKLIVFLLAFLCLVVGLSKLIHYGNEYKKREEAIKQVSYQLALSGPDERIREKIPEMIDRLKNAGMTYDECASVMETYVSEKNKSLEIVELEVSMSEMHALSRKFEKIN